MRTHPIVVSLVLALALIVRGSAAAATASEDAEPPHSAEALLSQGDRLLGAGQLQDAYSAYDMAARADSSNYMVYFKRAAISMSLGKDSQAIEDLDKALELRPEFEAATLQKGRALLRLGRFDEARALLEPVHDAKAKSVLDEARTAQKSLRRLEHAYAQQRWHECVDDANEVVKHASNNGRLRRIRGQCLVQLGKTEEAIASLGQALALQPNDQDAQISLAYMYMFASAEPERAVAQLKKYLYVDPDNRLVVQTHKRLRALQRRVTEAHSAIDKRAWKSAVRILVETPSLVEEARDMLSRDRAASVGQCTPLLIGRLNEWACEALSALGRHDSAAGYCTAALSDIPASRAANLARAEAALRAEEYDNAIHILRELTQRDPELAGDARVRELEEKALRLKRMAGRKDYYKILGVARDATQTEIKKAYRRLTIKFHPDKYKGELSPEAVQNKMADINLAYETLSNEETRRQFDNGIDPNDPESQQQHQQAQHPFAGGNPFGGHPFAGGQQFVFTQRGGQQQQQQQFRHFKFNF